MGDLGGGGDAPLAATLDVGRASKTWGTGEPPSGLAHRSSMSASKLRVMAPIWSFESLETPTFSATICTLRLLVPVAYISATAAITAFTTCSASLRSSSCMSMAPSSKRGMASMFGVGSDKIFIAVFVLS